MRSTPDRDDADLNAALTVAHRSAVEWLHSLPERGVPPRKAVEEMQAALGVDLPEDSRPSVEVIEARSRRPANLRVQLVDHRRRRRRDPGRAPACGYWPLAHLQMNSNSHLDLEFSLEVLSESSQPDATRALGLVWNASRSPFVRDRGGLGVPFRQSHGGCWRETRPCTPRLDH